MMMMMMMKDVMVMTPIADFPLTFATRREHEGEIHCSGQGGSVVPG
jgi:hypothetical protein